MLKCVMSSSSCIEGKLTLLATHLGVWDDSKLLQKVVTNGPGHAEYAHHTMASIPDDMPTSLPDPLLHVNRCMHSSET